jgi:hypothetical protein
MPSTSQRSFAGGEIAPSLYARSDQTKYQTGLRQCENFLVMRHGGVTNRPGTKFIASVKDSTKQVRLIKFIFNADQTYVLEFGNQYIRFIRNGVQLTSGGIPYEISSPYLESQLRDIQYVQSGDVITLVHQSHAPRRLSRTGHTSWTLTATVFSPSISPTTIKQVNLAGSGSISPGDSLNTKYVVTSVKEDTYEESVPSAPVTAVKPIDTERRNEVVINTVAGIYEYNVYSNWSGVYGYVGTARWDGSGTTVTFVDDGSVRSNSEQTPPLARNPFTAAGSYPGAVSYYQQRAVFANTINEPEKVWMSRTGNFLNFSIRSPLQDDDAVTFTIAGRQVNEVRHLIEVGQMLILTSGGEWRMQGDSDGVIRPSAINLKQEGYSGASKITPIVIGNNALYVQARGNIVRDLRYDLQSDGYNGRDLTVFAAHLFDGYQLTAWDYAQIPHSIVWVVRSDGVLLGLTYLREHDVWGWHRHDTDGAYEDVVCIPEGTEDGIYVVVRRTINGVTKRYIERFAPRYTSQPIDIKRDAFFVDCGATYDGNNTVTSRTMTVQAITGTTVRDTMRLVCSASFFSSADVGNAYELTVNGVSIRFKVISYTNTTTVVVQPSRDVPTGFTTTASWVKMVDEISGLSHLEGKDVSVLADGNVHPTCRVTNGAITLNRPCGVVHVGLPYTSTMQTLAIDNPAGETIVDKNKIIHKVSMMVESSRGVFVGPDENHLSEYKQRSNETYEDPTRPVTGLIEVQTVAKWEKNAVVTVQQKDPLPLSVLSVVPQVTVSPR